MNRPESPPRSATRLRGLLALTLASGMVATLLQAAGAPQASADDGGRPDIQAADQAVAGGDTGSLLPRGPVGPAGPPPAPRATWPAGATETVRLGGPRLLDIPETADDFPVSLSARGPALTAEVEVLAPGAGRALGAGGPVLAVTPGHVPDDMGVLRLQAAPEQPVDATLTLDYSDFADLYGGGYGSRLRLVELPACALRTPDEPRCRTRTPVESANDTEAGTLTAPSVSLTSGTPTVLAAVAEEESEQGDFSATALKASSTWETDLNAGDFTWSYEMPVPQVPGGLVPDIGLAYSSGGIDGRTSATNNQSSWAGDGFDLWSGYIERQYKPCGYDEVQDENGNNVGDQCWEYDNAFISFNGAAGELVPAGNDTWKLRGDNGTIVERLTGAARANGDDDNEYWRLTDPQGTRYYFGYHRLPGWSSGDPVTDSTWTVPVYGNDPGEPCHQSATEDAWCDQAWRWNLDYVVDARGHAMAYYYTSEENSYGRFLDETSNARYTRGGTLDRIEYGLDQDTVYSDEPLARVLFTSSERCLPDDGDDCSDIEANPQYWYDTPWDRNCDADADCDAGRYSPTFWTTKRLTGVTTQVRTDGAHQDVDSWRLTHHWGTADTDYQLLLGSIQRTGHTAEPAITLPKTTLGYTQLSNRMDRTGDGYAPFVKARLSHMSDEFGGSVDVGYSEPGCNPDVLPEPASNTTRCFPQYLAGGPEHDPDLQWFNKYVATSVTETDRTGGAPDQVTRYDYLGGAAWHYADDNGLVPEEEKTWSQWRGYGHVRVHTGGQGPDGMITQSDSYFLRGMDGDRSSESGGEKSVTVALDDDEGDPITDHASLAGFEYRTVMFSGLDGTVLEKTVNRPWHHETASDTRDWGTLSAAFTATASSRTWTSLDDGAGALWRTTERAFRYDTVAGRLIEVDERGDTASGDDDQCTRTTYATNSGKNILSFPAREETVAVPCAAAPDRAEDVTADTRYAYDGGDYGDAPTVGDMTRTAVLKDHDGTTAVYVESGTTYDGYGRQLTATDLTADVTVTGDGTVRRTPRGNGRTVYTEYTPATGRAVTIAETTPPADPDDPATAQTETTTLDPARGVPARVTDPNGRATVYAHDALGRLTKVWLPDRRTSQLPSHQFSYEITEGEPVAVGTSTIGNRGLHVTGYVVYDGFLRERQEQMPGPDGGRLIRDTFYDERGLVSSTLEPYFADGPPVTTLFTPDDASLVETQTRFSYDALGRETEARLLAGDGDGARTLSLTRTEYGGDRTTVIPPEGGTATTTVMNALGETIELRQHHERSAEAPYDATSYRYDAHGQLTEVADPHGNTWTYEYDLLGRLTATTDPDAGRTENVFDDLHRKIASTNSRGVTLAYRYDGLGREVEIREEGPTGPLRVQHEYDTLPSGKGELAKSTRWVAGEAYVTEVVEMDRRYRATRTRVTIPEREGALAGSYVSSTRYGPSGAVSSVGLPAAGGLPAQTVAFEYQDGTLRPIATTGPRGLSTQVSYSLTGKPLQYAFSAEDGAAVVATNTYEWGTQRLLTARVDREGQPGTDRHATYAYDQIGNVLSIADVSRTGTDVQCFAYDHLRRLTEAWTRNQQECGGPGSQVPAGGPAPYHHSYTYDAIGNRLTETWHEQQTTRVYTYAATQPHAVAAVTESTPGGETTATYGYDSTGNTVSRPGESGGQSLTWDAEGRVAEIEDPDGTAASYVYDAQGDRLIGRTATEATLHLGDTELRLPVGAGTAQATRYLDVGGGHTAIVGEDGVTFVLADHHGTGELAVDATTLDVVQRRTLPFGGVRGADPGADWPGTRGFVGGTDDVATGLTHLGAREYDPRLGRFLSLDPVMDLTDPQQIHGFAYADNNPLAFSDPTGLLAKKKVHRASKGKKTGKRVAKSAGRKKSGAGKATGGSGGGGSKGGGVRPGGYTVSPVYWAGSGGGSGIVPAPWATSVSCNALCQLGNHPDADKAWMYLGFGPFQRSPGGWDLITMFLDGFGPDEWYFTDGDAFTDEMRNTSHLEGLRERLSGMDLEAGEHLSGEGWDYSLNGRSKVSLVPQLFRDLGRYALRVPGSAGAEAFGSYNVEVHIESVDEDAGTATAVFRVTDTLSRESLLRTGYDEDDGLIPGLRRVFNQEPVDVEVVWRETIELQGDCPLCDLTPGGP